eukprot:COSAG02_NODE_1369_length_13028_cov_2.767345_7_plen_85_part_00
MSNIARVAVALLDLAPPSSGAAAGEGQRSTCLYEFAAAQEGDLGLQEGDVVIVTDQSDVEWWVGYVASQPDYVGQFPRSYVQLE